jgi:hypothetical protein
MNAPRRFWAGPPPGGRPPRDAEIMGRASSIELRLWHSEERGIEGLVEIHCSIGNPLDNRFRSDEEVEHEQRSAMAFIRDVLTSFEKKPDDGREGRQAAAG